ncbi:unnamed protein product [Linum trigynum]|uniref:Extensin-like n=1 Tax=Linum trigynum TaxID=586398 RepID=A0AAV2ELW9_9ROSI
MPAPPPPPVQVDVPDPPPPYERKPSKRVRERPNVPEVTPYPEWKLPPPLVAPQGVGPRSPQGGDPSSPQGGGPSSPQGAGPSSTQTPHQGSYYDPRSTYHQTPPSPTPISYNDPRHGAYYDYRPIYPPSPHQGGYYDYRPVYPPSPAIHHRVLGMMVPPRRPTTILRHGLAIISSGLLLLTVLPWMSPARPRKCRFPADTAPTSVKLPRPEFETCHRNHLLLLPSVVVQGARKPWVPVKLVDFLELYLRVEFNFYVI